MKVLSKGIVSTAVLAAVLLMSGCSNRNSCEIDDAFSKQSVADIEVAKLQSEVAEQNDDIVNDVIIEKRYEMFPPNAEVGECYTRVLIPEKYETVRQKVLVREASTKLIRVPAKYRTTYKKVLVREASTKLITTKPVYKTVRKRVLVKEPSTTLVTTKPVYRTVRKRVLVAPAHTEWKVGKSYISQALRQKTNATGEIICLVKVPAKYKYITTKELVKPACTISRPKPARYKLITQKILVKPATTIAKTIPAKYKTVAVKELVSPETTKTVCIPAKYKYINKKIKVKDSELKWLPVLCETNFTRPRVMMVQRALKNAGFNPGPIDGILGSKTKAAIRRFQKANHLATGALTIETLRVLGVYR